MTSSSLNKLNELLDQATANGTLYAAVFSGPAKGHSIQKISIRPIQTKQGAGYQITEQRQDKAIHRNTSPQELVAYLLIEAENFKQGVIHCAEADFHFLKSSKGQVSLLKKKPTRSQALPMHNRQKNYLLPEGKPIDFLVKLGIMNAQGKVYPQKTDKFRQINRFLEIVDDTLEALPHGRQLQILDFGCGKAYLSFALYYFMQEIKKMPVQLTGLDLKQDVIAFCNEVAQELGYKNLSFQVGDINGFKPKDSIDMVICLHACNTATDAALENAIRWGAQVILAVPCCQHELYSQIEQPQLASLLRHGVLRERFAALATDAARAEILEMQGYRCQIMEFIDLEHTPKNLLIRAILAKGKKNSAEPAKRYQAFANALHIKPSIAQRIMDIGDNEQNPLS